MEPAVVMDTAVSGPAACPAQATAVVASNVLGANAAAASPVATLPDSAAIVAVNGAHAPLHWPQQLLQRLL